MRQAAWRPASRLSSCTRLTLPLTLTSSYVNSVAHCTCRCSSAALRFCRIDLHRACNGVQRLVVQLHALDAAPLPQLDGSLPRQAFLRAQLVIELSRAACSKLATDLQANAVPQ